MKSIIKLTNRSIKSFFSRYLALLLIVFLGVGFFSGLKITKRAMQNTLQNYLDENNFYDFRVFSTLGFSSDSLDDFSNIDGVKSAEGMKSADALMDFSGKTDAYIINSIPSKINTLSLISGHLPNADNECVVDSKVFDKKDIGKTITYSDQNNHPLLSETEFTITGIVNSPLYHGI